MERPWPLVGSLCLLLAGAAWAPPPNLQDPKFESKAALLAARGAESLLCFTERLEDLVCFWEEVAVAGVGPDNYSFSYQLEGEPWKLCRLHQTATARGTVHFWCSLPTADTSSFVPLELRVTAVASGAQRYSRIIHINEVVLLDAPTGLLARQAEDGSHVVLRWHPPPRAPMASHIRYEVDVSAGSGAGGVQRVEILEGRTECVLSNLRGGTLYTFAVRARMAEPSFGGFWSAWSEPAALLTASDLDPLILTLSLILVLILLLLGVLTLLSHRRAVKQKIWPGVPSPESEFEGLFTVHKGDFQLWLYQNEGCLWWSPCTPDVEAPQAPLEVLSEHSWGAAVQAAEPEAGSDDDAGPLLEPVGSEHAQDSYLVLDKWLLPRSPPIQAPSGPGDSADLAAVDEGSEASSCSSSGALGMKPRAEGASAGSFEYTILDPSSQLLHPRAPAPELPPTPPHLQYLYLVVSDSGISADYSSGGSPEAGPYTNPYENSFRPASEPPPPSYVACS